MKAFKYIVFVVLVFSIYFAGIYLISGTFSLIPLSDAFEDFEGLQKGLLDTGATLLFLLVFSKVMLSLLSRIWLRARWLGIVVLIAGTLTGALLLLEYITFLDSRLLKVTSVLLATITTTMIFLSLVAAFTANKYWKQVKTEELLHKLSVRNPKSLIFTRQMRTSEMFLAPVIFLSYLVFLYFDYVYSDVVAANSLNVPVYTFVFILSFFVFVYALIRHNRRLLR